VQGVLASRIDRLAAEEKELLQQLAVIGREFPLSLVCQVVPQPEEELYRRLSSLQHKEFLYEQPAFPEVEYLFKHALTQEVAYNSVLVERRKVLHERTAQAMEALFHATLVDHYGDLAHHYSRSANTPKAVEYLHLAGQQAMQRSANAEAVSHLTSALELLQTLPDASKRVQQELALQIALGIALGALKGYAAPEVEKVYARALALCRPMGETPQLFPVLYGLFAFHLVRAELQKARELGEQFLSLARKKQDPVVLLTAHRQLGDTLLWLGDVASARAHLEQGIAFHDPQQHRSLVFLYGDHPGMICLGLAAFALWYLGYPDQALSKKYEALTLAQDLSHPHSLVFALNLAAMFHQLRREEHQTQKQAEEVIALATEFGCPEFLASGTILWGWALAEQGEREAGLARIRQGLAAWRATGLGLLRPYFLALLAEACGKAGQAEEGLTVLSEALETVHRTGERHYEAELYRLKGELSLQSRSPQSAVSNPQSLTPNPQAQVEAEACFWKAIEIARKQQARSWELRAAMSLSRLWRQQGKKDAARKMLAAIYGWFTEGFDTKDLQEAKALLADLAETP
jgi:predicted ATPase